MAVQKYDDPLMTPEMLQRYEFLNKEPYPQKWVSTFSPKQTFDSESAAAEFDAQARRTNLADQIRSQNTLSKWTGEGFGGPDANLDVMVSLLADAGIDDIKDFGKITIKESKPSFYDPETYTQYGPLIETERTVWGNKKTGQPIFQNYNMADASGNVWQGTYSGHGRTNFNVEFGPDGTPYFYTRFGGDTSSAADIVPIVSLGLALFAPGVGTAIGAALGASGVAASVIGNAIVQGTLAEASGGDFMDGAVRGAISGGVAPAMASSVGSAVADALADSAVKNVVASAISSSVSSAIVAGATGQDVGAAALNGAVMGAAGAAGQDIGAAAQYGTTPFSEQTQALMAQDRGMGFSGSTVGQNIGSAVGSIALGTPEDQALMGALTKTVSQGLSSLPSFFGTAKAETKVADSGEEETQVAEAFDADKLKSIIFNSASQLASNGDPSIDLAEIERLRGEGNFADTDTSTSVGAGDVTVDQADGEPSALDVLGQPISQEAVNVEPVIPGATEPLVTEPMMPDPLVPSADNPNLEPGKTPQERAEEEWRRYMDSLSVKPEQLDIAPQDINEGQYWDEYNKNLKEIMDRGGFTSQWQQAGTDRVFVNDDGTGIGINENGDSYALTADEVKSMIDNGILNTLESGYVAATGGDQAEPNKLNTTNVTTTTVGAPNVVNPAARNLNSILSMGSAATQAPIREVDSSMDATRSSPAPFGQEGKFQGPLDDFFKIATQASYIPTPNKSPTPQQPQQAATMTDRLDQPQTGSGYFNYGQQTDIESNLFPQMGQPAPMIGGGLPFKQGGMATPLMAGGGTTRYGRYAGGGLNVVEHSGKRRFDFRQGDAVTGAGDGQSDDIPAMLADGEFVFPADVVAALGNGSTKAGSDKLYDMMHSIRAYHRSAKPEDLPPPAKKSPLDYLKKSKKAKKARS